MDGERTLESLSKREGSALMINLSQFLFVLVMDGLTCHIQREVPQWVLFNDDIVLVDNTHNLVNDRLGFWQHILESKGFMLSRIKIEYLKCKFSGVPYVTNVNVPADTQVIPKKGSFKFLRSII